jgi:hypothetical protein
LRYEQHEVLEQFLADVDEQIQYRPMHAAVNEELRAHVEDKAALYMDYGVEENQAYDRAVREMGDASAIGISMNEAHHLRTAKPLLILILILTALGIAGNLVSRGFAINEVFYNGYFLWGLLVLFAVMYRGYPLVLKLAGKLLWGMVILGAAALAGRMALAGLVETGKIQSYPFTLFSPSVIFGIMQLMVPVTAVLLYRRRHKGARGLWLLFLLLTAVMLAAGNSYLAEYSYVSFLTLFFACLGTVCYMFGKGLLEATGKGIAFTVVCFLVLLGLWGFGNRDRSAGNLENCFHAEEQAASAWEDTYNSILIRELLGRARAFGGVELTKEELVRYGTSQWYYEDGEGIWSHEAFADSPEEDFQKYVEYRMQFLENPRLEDILPQHYLNNYRFAWWILRYGWIPGILLLLLNMAAYVLMFLTAFRIKNRLGRLMAFSGGLAFSIQFLFYFMGNFGFQFGAFGNLPFVSEGLVSITGTMIMAGLILSAYRFDTVVTEEA